ncbi:restriction endonuclease subunit S [Undibacterium sp. WLX3042]|uniref:restriction endonuclease subunit S n=1 Tax=Undibacterium sp. WLX3042 TaxID=3412686 RepID=UPI003C2C3900
MSGLPKGWVESNALEIAEPVRGVSYKKEQVRFASEAGYTAVLRANNIQENKILLEDLVFVPDANINPLQRLLKNDVVIAMSSGSLSVVGKSAQVSSNLNASFGAFCGALRPHSIIDPRYLGLFLKSDLYRRTISNLARGTNINNLKWEHFKEIPLPLAPRDEQKRIADKLDTVLARVDACRERLNRVPLILKRFRQSVLAAATSGKLTEDWRKLNISVIDEPNVIEAILSPIVIHESDKRNTPSGWEWINLTKLAKLESGHTPRKTVPEYWENGDIPWISLQDIRNADGRELFDTKYKPTQIGIDNSSARILPKGTVCFCRDISFGYVTIMGRPMATTQHFANWVCNENLLPKFLMYVFMAGRNFLSMSGQGTTVTTIYMPALKELKILRPSIAEQTEIVRRVETLFAFADRLETRLANASAAADKLTPAFLAKAFRGELVPQDPNDEPASALLQRLAQANAGKEKAPRAKRGTQASKVTQGQMPA